MRNKQFEKNFDKFCEENNIDIAVMVLTFNDGITSISGRNIEYSTTYTELHTINCNFVQSILGNPELVITTKKK